MRAFYFLLAFAVALTIATPSEALVTGTNGNDIIFFQGTSQSGVTVTNAYTGETLVLGGTFNANTQVYDGLAGIDTLFMTNVSDLITLRDGSNNQTILRIERIIAGNGDDVINLSDGTFVLGNISLEGGEGNDVMWGNSGGDTINGFDGDDILNGGPNNDTLSGQNDNDKFFFGPGSGFDTVNGGSGFDEIVFLGGINRANLTITPFGSPGNLGFNILVGSSGEGMSSEQVEQLRFADGSTLDLTNFDQVSDVPEPSTVSLILLGGPYLWAARRRKWRVTDRSCH
jgi:Ca2+-binding RTX toxin-like protein